MLVIEDLLIDFDTDEEHYCIWSYTELFFTGP